MYRQFALPPAMFGDGFEGAWEISTWEIAISVMFVLSVLALWGASAWMAGRLSRNRGWAAAIGWSVGLVLGPLALLLVGFLPRRYDR